MVIPKKKISIKDHHPPCCKTSTNKGKVSRVFLLLLLIRMEEVLRPPLDPVAAILTPFLKMLNKDKLNGCQFISCVVEFTQIVGQSISKKRKREAGILRH